MKLYKYYIVYDKAIGDIIIQDCAECAAEIYNKNLIKHKIPKGIEKIYKVSDSKDIKFLPNVAINSVAYPMYEKRITDVKPSYYCIFTDVRNEENIRLFKKLIFENSFLAYVNLYGSDLN